MCHSGQHPREVWAATLVGTLRCRYDRFVTIRLVLAEDNALLRQGLVRLFAQTDGIDVVASVASMDVLLAAVEEHAVRRGADRHPHAADVHRRGRSGRPSLGGVTAQLLFDDDLVGRRIYFLESIEASRSKHRHIISARIYYR